MRMIKDILFNNYQKRYWIIRDQYLKTTNKIKKTFLYYRLKKIENKCNADLGTSYHDPSTQINGHLNLPHGLNGIVISRLSRIGHNVTVFHQVTIGLRMGGGSGK